MPEMNKVYQPKDFEKKHYQAWMESGAFRPEVDENKKPYTITMPPPNVTGNLHMGHAMNNTLQDILIRYKRMAGFNALWVPGMDHASISTEARVVDKLKKEGKTKDDLGREKFLEAAWDWTREYGGNIKNQLMELGVSCDWSREKFTLDEDVSEAVLETFVDYYDKGLIYQGDRIINWCPSCGTAISDAEVDHEDHQGHIWSFRYPLVKGEGYIEIATTRPETIPGDLAVAVHPEDERYKDLVGEYVRLPILDREIPIIADAYVDMEFGTGAVKITPSHDPNDFEVGERHDLGQLKVIDEEAKLNENAGKYQGMDRYEARKAIIADFEAAGFYAGAKDHNNAVGHCERCGTVIEPLLSKQWFVEMAPLAKPALEAYQDGRLRFVPERFGKIYSHWLENIRDWCISRQLWWGHRLPVYYCQDCGEIMVAKSKEEACQACGSQNIKQDEDTLDTWFSSALWPYSTLGWPKGTEDFKYFYPTNTLVTGYDIIFFWVVRMVFSALEATGEVPFTDVYLTGLVLDDQGRKMSKSLGNGIDPLEVIDQYGADALRFTLVTGTSPGNDTRFSTERMEASRNFANKLWNAARFVLMNLPEDFALKPLEEEALELEDKWILSRTRATIEEAGKRLDRYDIGLAADAIHDFIWDDYCDWYIEMVKPRLYGEDPEAREGAYQVLVQVLEDILKLLHPFMPFITEEIWSFLPQRETDLILASWPEALEAWHFPKEEGDMAYLQKAIRSIRNARSEMNIEPHRKSMVYIHSGDQAMVDLFKKNTRHLQSLAKMTDLEEIQDPESLGDAIAVVVDRAELFLPMRDLVDFEKEVARLEKEEEKIQKEIDLAQKKLSNDNFVKKAPQPVVQKERDRLEKYQGMLEQIKDNLAKARKKQ
ncbi:MAG: valine--tRNA ligase [Tissierellia bacterium]|nr:valine--tRNA ligase [Tissierellia bacterium]